MIECSYCGTVDEHLASARTANGADVAAYERVHRPLAQHPELRSYPDVLPWPDDYTDRLADQATQTHTEGDE